MPDDPEVLFAAAMTRLAATQERQEELLRVSLSGADPLGTRRAVLGNTR